MASDEVDAPVGIAPDFAINVGAAQNARAQRRNRVAVAAHKAAHVVAEGSVPFTEAIAQVYKSTNLIKVQGIPRLRDKLGARQNRIKLYGPEYSRVLKRLSRDITREHRGQSKRKPSTCISDTQYRRLSMINLPPTG